MSNKLNQDEGQTEDVDLSSVPSRSGMTFYASTKIERTASGLREQIYGNVTYSPPPGMALEHAIELHTQTHQAVLTRAWLRARERLLAIEQGNELPVEQFEVDLVTGEIL